MSSWYEILGVSPDATQEQIDEAFARQVPREADPNQTEDQAEQRRLLEHAYGVLGDPGRRAQYDAERAAAPATPAPGVPSPQAAPEAKRSLPLGPILGAAAIVVAIVAVAVTLFIVVQDDEDTEAYPDRGDEVDLEAMRLRDEDLPAGFTFAQAFPFSNEEWAAIISDENPEAAQRSLEAEGRLRNLLSVYTSEQLGRTLGIFSISTLYTDDASASRSMDLFCGLPVGQGQDIRSTALVVPDLGEQSTGFLANGVMSAEQYREATMCFRTGRIVHAVSLAALPGVEDIALAVRLAERMESRVDDYYDGNGTPEPEDDGS